MRRLVAVVDWLPLFVLALILLACKGGPNPNRPPQPAPGPAVTTDQPRPSGVEVAVR